MNLFFSLDFFVLPKGIFPLQSYLRYCIKGCETPRPDTDGSREVPVTNSRLRTESLQCFPGFLFVPPQSKHTPNYTSQNLQRRNCRYSDLRSLLASQGFHSPGKATQSLCHPPQERWARRPPQRINWETGQWGAWQELMVRGDAVALLRNETPFLVTMSRELIVHCLINGFWSWQRKNSNH